jgi:hypothetical protein
MTAATIDDNLSRSTWDSLLDLKFERAPAQMCRVGQVPAQESLLFAHIENENGALDRGRGFQNRDFVNPGACLRGELEKSGRLASRRLEICRTTARRSRPRNLRPLACSQLV